MRSPHCVLWLWLLLSACHPDSKAPASPVGGGEDTGALGEDSGGGGGDTGVPDTLEVGAYETAPVRLLPLGDSITEYGYRYNLWTRLVDAEYSVDLIGSMVGEPSLDGEPHVWPSHQGQTMDADHEGHAGWTSREVLLAPPTWDAKRGSLSVWLEGYTPDIVLIHLGTNDAFYEYSASAVMTSLTGIIARLREANPRVRIHLAQIIPLPYPYWGGGTYDTIVQGYNAAIADLAADLSTAASPVFLVDQYTGFDGEGDTYDLIHPNASGDEKMAARWMASIAADAAPVAVDDGYESTAGPLVVAREAGVLANDRSLRGAVRAVLVQPPAHGELALRSDGSFTYTGDGTPDTFTYVADDGEQSSVLPATVSLCAGAGCIQAPPAGLYVDCAAGEDTADGRTPETAWGSLARLAAAPLLPGDAVWLVAGTTCEGTLSLQGEGSAEAPITVGAWGEGAPPVIDARGAMAAVRLQDQSFLTLSDLEIQGARRWGVYVTAATELVEGITLRNLEVHGIRGAPLEAKGTGLVVFSVDGVAGWFEDILVEGVQAWDTDQWSGIFLHGTVWRAGGPRSTGITFRDNIVHDVAGDGIVVFGAADALLEANLTYEVGLASTDEVGTPNAIWTWDCHQCTVQFNEAHHTHTPGVDGGAFDIDWDNVDNIVQYNYGHDNDGYCVAVFAAEDSTTTGSIVRHNVCIDNSQDGTLAYQGDIFLYTWNGGTLGDVQVYNNTVVRSEGYPPLVVWAPPGEGSGFWNNLFVLDSDWLATLQGDVPLTHNLWWQRRASGGDAWLDDHAGGWYSGPGAWEAAHPSARSNVWADPLLNASGTGREAAQLTAGSPAIDAGTLLPDAGLCDAFGGALSGTPDIGAHAWGAKTDPRCAP